MDTDTLERYGGLRKAGLGAWTVLSGRWEPVQALCRAVPLEEEDTGSRNTGGRGRNFRK